jgi:hypothetical protein
LAELGAKPFVELIDRLTSSTTAETTERAAATAPAR